VILPAALPLPRPRPARQPAYPVNLLQKSGAIQDPLYRCARPPAAPRCCPAPARPRAARAAPAQPPSPCPTPSPPPPAAPRLPPDHPRPARAPAPPPHHPRSFGELTTRWVALDTWTFETAFTVDEDVARRANVDLVLDGVDTFATITVNDEPVANLENFHRWGGTLGAGGREGRRRRPGATRLAQP
jgi:hypothetical protein